MWALLGGGGAFLFSEWIHVRAELHCLRRMNERYERLFRLRPYDGTDDPPTASDREAIEAVVHGCTVELLPGQARWPKD